MKWFALFPLVALASLGSAQEATLQFNKNGAFKILQVADLHYCNGHTDGCGDVLPEEKPFCTGLNTTAFYKRVIDEEDPDFIVFTGDQIDGCAANARLGVMESVLPAAASGKPWAAVLGNHDGENTLSRRQVIDILASLPGSLTRVGPADLEDPDLGRNSNGNYLVRLVSHKKHVNQQGGGVPEAEVTEEAEAAEMPPKKQHGAEVALWFLDSGSTHQEYEPVRGDKHVGGYDWVRPQQIAWMQKADLRLRQQAKRAKRAVRPALAFFHIPLMEYDSLLRHPQHARSVVGNHQEAISSAEVNSGLYSTLITTGVAAAFVGHDHTNDYCGKYVGGVQLCFGGGAGYHTYGKAGFARRVRVINIERFGKKATSWKRLDTADLRKEDKQVLYDADSMLSSERLPAAVMGYEHDESAETSAESGEASHIHHGDGAMTGWDEKYVPEYARESEATQVHTLKGTPLRGTRPSVM